MPAIVYPSALPGPSGGWAAVLRQRAAASSLPGNPQARRRWRDRIQDVSSAQWVYAATEMAAWREWFHETLIDGQRWFLAEAPGAGGFIDRVMRFRPSSLRVQPLGGGHCRVSAQLEVRGRAAPPFASDMYFLDEFVGELGALLGDHAPEIAPPGFAWPDDATLALSGDGQLVGNETGALGLAFSISPQRPYYIEMVAARPTVPTIAEADLFEVRNGDGDVARLGLLNPVFGSGQVNASWEGDVGTHVELDVGTGEHTLRLVFNEDDTATALLDGVAVETFACTPPANPLTRVYVYSSVAVEGPGLVSRLAVGGL